MSTSGSDCAFQFPPTLRYHLIEGNAPDIYIIFLLIACLCFVITLVVSVPNLLRIKTAAKVQRDENDAMLEPLAFEFVFIIAAFPLCAVFGNLFVLIAPLFSYTAALILALYMARVLVMFYQVIIMYMGSFKSARHAWVSVAPKSLFYGSKPCCCLRLILKPKHMDKPDFRRLSSFISQYMWVVPVTKMAQLFPTAGVIMNGQWIGYVETVSMLLCVYGCAALATASKEVLKDYNIEAKFRTLQLSVTSLSATTSILALIHVSGYDDAYTDDVIRTAIASVVRCVLFMLLSISYRTNFNVDTARDADRNAKSQSFVNNELDEINRDANGVVDESKTVESSSNYTRMF